MLTMHPESSIAVAGRTIGSGHPCFIVAEVAQAHDGSLGTAHAYIDAAAQAGASAVKFQTHIAAEESTPDEPFRVRFSPQDETRYEYWRRMEFTESQWRGLADHALECGLVFLSSPFSLAAVELLQRIGVPAWKIGAGELTNVPLLEAIAATGLPAMLSTGLADWRDIDAAVQLFRQRKTPVAVLQCTSAYPCPPEQLGLNVLAQFRERYNSPVGLSDHSGNIFAGLAAVTLGANLLEVHIVFSRDCFGPDVTSSLTIDELAQLVRGVRFVETAQAHPVDKDELAGNFTEMRRIFGKSVVAARALSAGHRLARVDLAFKKPGTGIPAEQWEKLIGQTLNRGMQADQLFADEDVR
jgi:N-acetylneuraminate synthase